jgi:hypothetical protein
VSDQGGVDTNEPPPSIMSSSFGGIGDVGGSGRSRVSFVRKAILKKSDLKASEEVRAPCHCVSLHPAFNQINIDIDVVTLVGVLQRKGVQRVHLTE